MAAHREPWTKEDDDFIIDNYLRLTYRQIGELLGRTREATKTRAIATLKLRRGQAIDDERRRLYDRGYSDDEIAEIQGVTPHTIRVWRERHTQSPDPFTEGADEALHRQFPQDLYDALVGYEWTVRRLR